MNAILISYCCSKVYELYHILKDLLSTITPWFCYAFWWWDI